MFSCYVPEDHTAAETSSQPKGCKYCVKQAKSMPWYPKFKFKTATKSTVVVVEVNERIPMRFKNKSLGELLPDDYWDFIPKDPEPEESCLKSNMRTLSTPQDHIEVGNGGDRILVVFDVVKDQGLHGVYLLLKDVEQKFVEKLALRAEYLFLTCLPVTPNCNRVMEATQVYGMSFLNTERPKKYENELNTEKSKKNEMKGSKWMKNTVLSKRTDNALRMTVVGDPNIKLGEIGLPRHIADKLEIPENLNSVNWVNLNACCSLRLLEKGELKTRREGRIIHVNHMNKVQVGDTVYRPLEDGDIVLINRPPSIHQHAIIAFTVKVLPTTAVMSLNPVCCSPFRGDFDGDCLHGFIPQSMESRVELKELVALNRQVLNGQNGRNLLSLCHDSLSAAYLVKEKGVFLNKFQMQQLLLMCPRQLFSPAILNTNQNQTDTSLSWTGSQLLSMLLPQCLNYKLPSSGKGIHVSKGEIMSSSPDCTWLQDKDENLFSSLIKHYGDKVLDFMFHIQEVLLEWISMRGLSVSLSDLYLSPDSNLREKMVEEVRYGLQDAEQSCHLKQLVMDSRMNTMDCVEEDQTVKDLELSLNKNNVGAFKEVFRNVQNLPFRYASRDNSLLSMVKAGSKGNLSKLVQQSLCVGLQQPSIPLSFRVPSQLSCASWNHQKLSDLHQKAHCIPESSVPYALVKSSFISGLNPLECFVHSLSSRDSSFSDNADLPGTLSRKLMSYMRDIYKAYDGTVRSSYGNQLVQFSYANRDKNSIQEDTHSFSGKSVNSLVDFGSPVGSLAAYSISEAAYGALDQPIGTLETSPLVNLKKVLESGQKKVKRDQSISLFLSKEAIRWHGMEHASLKVKSHLERVLFSDVVSTVMIFFSEQISNTMRFSPWVCHFHISKERMDRRGLNEQSIRDALNTDCEKARVKAKFCIPKLRILSR
ncbi:hypothetical protein GIB67_024503 [Kingdonia uniflora]|uniref:DNA-directed RNA polymerase n=1 Tax=Kingdonia uniflora TaxID=39325 RepID=A0A7J7LNP1_9MAGN|nr:hypothetical protein GIB67_024503 [Kingdonia uniflora]